MAGAAHHRARRRSTALSLPPVRVVPPLPTQLAGDPLAPATVFLAGDDLAVSLATVALGLGVTFENGAARVSTSRGDLLKLAGELAERGSPLGGHLRRYLSPVSAWRTRTREFPLDRAVIVGILNLTVDSFSGDGVGGDIDAALRHAETLRAAGADVIDIGAESARADRPALDETEEAQLISGVTGILTREGHCVSIDTYKPGVARRALESGAEIVNDISGLTIGTGAAAEAASAGAAYILNYSYSVPKRRPDTPPVYDDVVTETIGWMFERVASLRGLGIEHDHMAIDPGIAFGKSHADDIEVIRRMGEMTSLGLPVILAHSRKNFIGSITGRPPAERDLETQIATSFAAGQGARIFRVHNPAGARRAAEFALALVSTPSTTFAPDMESWPWRAGASAAHMTSGEPDKPAPGGQRW